MSMPRLWQMYCLKQMHLVYTLTEQKICLGIFKKSVLEESIFMLNRRSYSMRLLLQR